METQFKKKKNLVQGENPYMDKSSFKGTFLEGYRSGFGVEKTNHAVYEGSWNKGKKEGKGKIVYNNGDTYEGEW
jgi:hypothetical protein